MTDAEYDLRERECIMEFDGGLTREEAERKAAFAAEMALILAEALTQEKYWQVSSPAASKQTKERNET